MPVSSSSPAPHLGLFYYQQSCGAILHIRHVIERNACLPWSHVSKPNMACLPWDAHLASSNIYR